MDEEKDTTRRFRNERLPENRRRSAEENMSPTVEPCVEIGGGQKRKRDGNEDQGEISKRRVQRDDRSRREGDEVIHTRPHDRPKKGIMGKDEQPVKLIANYFSLGRTPQWNIFKYHVSFEPEVDMVGFRRALLAQHKEQIGGYLFDGMQIFVTHSLGDVLCLVSKSREGDEYHVTIKLTVAVDLASTEALQFLNLVQRGAMRNLGLVLVGRNYFDEIAKVKMQAYPITIWPGYTTSIRYHEHDILVCAEVTHKVMRDQTVLDIVRQEYRSDRNEYRENVERLLLGRTVLTAYNNKTYRIDEIDFDKSPESTFKQKDVDVSFIQYYQQKWNQTIRDTKQPLLVTKASAKDRRSGKNEISLLVPELCYPTGITDREKNDNKFMRAMADLTRVGPAPRIAKLLSFNQRLHSTPASMGVLDKWKLQLNPDLIKINGRKLAKQQILVGAAYDNKGNPIFTTPECDWTASLRNKPLFQMTDLKRWYMVYPRFATKEAESFLEALKQVSKGMGFHMSNPRMSQIDNDRINSYVEVLQRCANENPQLICCVLGKKAPDSYAAIKKMCSIDRAVPTQVICQQTMRPKGSNPNSVLSVATKVAIQMSCKIGGAPWHVHIPLKGLMTIGFDAATDSSNKKKSYGALVANMVIDDRVHFFSCVSEHKTGEQLTNHFNENIIKALKEYYSLSGALPSRICIYRDGVGDGQIQYIKETEIVQLKQRLNDVYTNRNKEYQLLFIVVTKRINTRLFLENKTNPGPGTVVDDVITLPERYDFFLISQHVRQGSVSPTCYNVLVDETSFTPNQVQTLTYKYTHLYYNWPGTVRVPSVCQYASKLAFLVSQSIHDQPHVNLSKSLYFL